MEPYWILSYSDFNLGYLREAAANIINIDAIYKTFSVESLEAEFKPTILLQPGDFQGNCESASNIISLIKFKKTNFIASFYAE